MTLKSNAESRKLMLYSLFGRGIMSIGMNYSGIYAAEIIGLGAGEFGISSALSTIATQLTQPLWGYISDLKGVRKYFIALGEIIFGITTALVFTLKTFQQYMLSSIIIWVFWSGAFVCWQALMGDLTTKDHRGRTIGIIEFAGIGGALIANIIVGPLIDVHGYGIATITTIIFTLLAVIPVLIIHEEGDILDENKVKYRFSWKIDATNEYKKYLILSTLWWGVMSISWPIFSLTQVKIFCLTKTEVAILSITGSIGQMIMMPLWGNIADKFGRRNLLVISCMLTSIWPLAYAISQNYIQLLVLNTIGSALGSSINIIPGIYLLDTIPLKENRATLVSIYNTITGGAQAIGQYIGGEIASNNGLRETMMLSAILRIMFAIPMFTLPETLTKSSKKVE
ncbi:MAG: MFS transporter [Candidatus Methanomethylicia archaeon]